MGRLELFTDGGCSPNPGRGGWAVVVVDSGKVVEELFGGEDDTSNNRMELTAAIRALEWLQSQGREAVVHTDSNYVRHGITDWIRSWKARGWRTAGKTPVKNQDLWERLDALNLVVKPEWAWVKGHSGHEFNERADELVGNGRERE